MKHEQLKQQLKTVCAQLDEAGVVPPIEFSIGDVSLYPYQGFSDILQMHDFNHLKASELRTLLAICHDLRHMQNHALFEAFVHDDGVISIDEDQPYIEYSVDISHHHSTNNVYPQITYPINLLLERHQHERFIGNDTAHESAHHMDSWVDMRSHSTLPIPLHSSSNLLQWCVKLDRLLHPNGLSNLILEVRKAHGYEPRALLKDGYKKREVLNMLRAEFFAITAEYYYGTKQNFAISSPLLEAYFRHIVALDVEIQGRLLSIREMHLKRGILRRSIHAPLEDLLNEHYPHFNEAFYSQHKADAENIFLTSIEALGCKIRKLIEK